MKKNSHPVKVVEIKDYKGLYANSHPYQVEVEGGGGGETYNDFTGATASTAGEHGLVPAPKAGDNNKYLKGDGTWAEVEGGESGIPTDATFWGASYDSVNNKVDGNIKLSTNASGVDRILGGQNSMGLSFNHNGSNRILNVHTAYSGSDIEVSLGTSRSGNSWGAGTGIGLKAGPLGIILNDKQIHYVADPGAAQDAATKNYTDNLVISYASLNGAGAPTMATEGKYVGQLYYDTTNEQLYFLKEIDDTTTPATYTWETVGGSSVNVVQTTGTSQTDVMSQVATSRLIYPSGSETTHNHIAIGEGASSSSSYGRNVAIGYRAKATGTNSITVGSQQPSDVSSTYPTASGGGAIVIGGSGTAATITHSIAIGTGAKAEHAGSIAIGGDGQKPSRTGRNKELSIGRGTAGNANEETRYIAHVTDPQYVTDAANKRYVDTAVASAGAATYTPSEFNNLWENA